LKEKEDSMGIQPLAAQVNTYELECPPFVELHSLYEMIPCQHGLERNEETLQHELQQEFSAALSTLILTLKVKDPQLYEHSCRVQQFTHRLAQALRLPQEDAVMIELAGLFHDIGKISIDNDLLQKASYLTRQEFEDIKQHAARGAQIISQVKMLKRVVPMVRHHHERWDGQGYPAGLRGEAIPFGARMIAIADAFEVMTSHRPYITARTPAQALEELRRCAGTQFDPILVDRFCSCLEADCTE
jgi:putative nucleotidyltransferase with HDIG domain